MRRLLIALLTLLFSGCATGYFYVHPDAEQDPVPPLPEGAEITYRVLLVGDTGAPGSVDGPFLTLLDTRLERLGESSAAVFLGDNLYPDGMPPVGHEDREEMERRMDAQIEVLRDYPGRIVWVPGNHDWQHSGSEGLAYVRRTEEYLETHLDRGDVWLPSNGFPGPIPVELTDDITLVALDTQWWLHPYARPTGDTGEYTVRDNGDVLVELEDVLSRYEDTNIIVAGHHPLVSSARHAGVFAPQNHLFPLRETKLTPLHWLPLPGIGSIALFYNRIIGLSRQDVAHPDYEALRRSLLDLFSDYEDLVYAAGHEHNLQYYTQTGREGLQHLIVSGSGSEGEYVRGGGDALFTAAQQGLVELIYLADGSIWLEAYTIDGGSDRPIYRQLISGVDEGEVETVEERALAARPTFADSTVRVAINPDYDGGWLRRTFVGDGWRDAWTQPVDLPVFDLAEKEGGLEIVKRGGGLQTRSLRLQKPDSDRQYVLRTVDKYPAAALPAALRYGIAVDVAEEMTTAIHPFAAPVAARLADAVGVYHTRPKLYYLPDDPLLGRYREDFANRVVLFEERPDEDWSDAPNFGRSENLIGTSKLYQEIEDDNDHRVDQTAFLRARLLDLFLGDWDRHRDQWRWASFEPYELDSTLTGDARERGKVYRPIPRDRDWALNDRDGWIFRLSRRFVDKTAGLQEDYGSISSMTINGTLLDQRFLNELERDEWMEMAREVQSRLTDEAIEEAVRLLPPEVYRLHGDVIVRRMKDRRAKLDRVAEKFYDARAGKVDIAGSQKHERFEVYRRKGETEVVMIKTNSEGELIEELYRRTFDNDETKEIRLYGFDGNDQFVVSGQQGGGPVVRLIGGSGADVFDATDGVVGFRNKTVVYDVRGTNEGRENDWRLGPEARFESSEHYPELSQTIIEQKYDETTPLLFVARNPDDGLFLGGGVRVVRQGFLKEPYGSRQTIRANASVEHVGAFNAVYSGHFTHVVGPWGLTLDASYRSPLTNRNFFGFGNDVDLAFDPNARFYRNRTTRGELMMGGRRNLPGDSYVTVGPLVQYTDVNEEEGRFITTPAAGIESEALRPQAHVGLRNTLRIDSQDNPAVPKRGFDIELNAEVLLGVSETATDLATLRGDFVGYLTPFTNTWLTLAPRFGGQTIFGDFPFWAASTLGAGPLRGYRPDRFAGRTSVYGNMEARVRLQRFSGYAGYGEWGVFGFLDSGRVWADQNPSRTWHAGYGGGLWLSALDQVVFTAQVAASKEDRLITFGVGWHH
jgi:hypothetical protein